MDPSQSQLVKEMGKSRSNLGRTMYIYVGYRELSTEKMTEG